MNDPSLVRDCVWIAFLVLRVGVSPNHSLFWLPGRIPTSPLTVCMCLISMVPRSISLLSLVVNAVYVWCVYDVEVLIAVYVWCEFRACWSVCMKS